MANSAQARKRARQAEKRRQLNSAQRSAMRTTVKAVLKAINAGDKEQAQAAFGAAASALDKAAGKGLVHKNMASRSKSRLNARVRAMA